MYMIGQPHIINALRPILIDLYETGKGENFLIRGPSGYGKTRLALMICNYLVGGNFQMYIGENFEFDNTKRVHFIDEVHLLTHPELLYPVMDKREKVIILATNATAELPEALCNRCIDFTFDNYSIEELREIARMYLTVQLPEDMIDYLIEAAGYNPRIISGYARRLTVIFERVTGVSGVSTLDEFKNLLEVSLGIKDGMDTLCHRYVTALKALGGTASIETLASYTHIDRQTMKFFVEPALLYKKLIKISSKGRSLCI